MANRTLRDIRGSWRAGVLGNSDLVFSAYTPFLQDISSKLKALGFTESLDGFQIPPSTIPLRQRATSRKDISLATLAVTFLAFLGVTASGWAVTKVCDELYDAKIRPALLDLIERVRQKSRTKKKPYNVRFSFGVWYDTDQLCVLVVADINTSAEVEAVEVLIPAAHRAAVSWLNSHGKTSRVLIYRIRDGQLSERPELTDRLPRE